MFRVSRKFGQLAVDSELWKAAYYDRFVLPRASRIPGIQDAGNAEHLYYSSKVSKWLDDGHLLSKGQETNWKQQYRLRHNWAQGQCAVSEIVVSERSPDPPLLVMMYDGIVFTADSISGLRAWTSNDHREILASAPLLAPDTDTPQLPTSMAPDSRAHKDGSQRLVIGFENGSFAIYALHKERGAFTTLFTHAPSTNGMLSALAYSSPFLLTMTEDHLLSVYSFPEANQHDAFIGPSQLLYSLRSQTAWPPVSLSLRITATSMTAAIAYALPTHLSGWTVGIQELKLSHSGDLLESRLGTAANESFNSISSHRSMSSPSTRSSSPFPGRSREPALSGTPSSSKPTSMSYSHPYLLATHPDNTLTLYLVKSTSSSLSIGPGSRLWGHTSGVSGAHVGMRGKAVSVSRLGEELRVWDLEGGMPLSTARRRSKNGELSVRVHPAKLAADNDVDLEEAQPYVGLRLALEQGYDDSTISRGWVGFDDQNVVVLREKSHGSQALVVYNFT
jgi:hypothetical protein